MLAAPVPAAPDPCVQALDHLEQATWHEGAIRRIKEAESAVLVGRSNQRCRGVPKATAIVEGLQAAWITSAAAKSPAI